MSTSDGNAFIGAMGTSVDYRCRGELAKMEAHLGHGDLRRKTSAHLMSLFEITEPRSKC